MADEGKVTRAELAKAVRELRDEVTQLRAERAAHSCLGHGWHGYHSHCNHGHCHCSMWHSGAIWTVTNDVINVSTPNVVTMSSGTLTSNSIN